MINKEYISNNIKRECNVLSIFWHNKGGGRSKNIHSSSILQGCMNTCIRRVMFKNFRIKLDSESSSSDRLQRFLIMIMSHLLTSYVSFLISRIGGGSICDYKVTTCDIIYGSPRSSKYTIMKLCPVWINTEVQAHIEPPPIPIFKNEIDDMSECDII